MAERVVLHVGLMKSGTSFVQQVLGANRDVLASQGVLYPSPWRRQVAAVRDVAARGGDGQPPLSDGGAWRSLVEEVRAWPGTAVISMEFLGPRRAPKARQIIADLAPAHVEVVITVRDLARTVPAMWQETLQNRGTLPWPEYLAGVREEDRDQPGPGRAFWKRQDAPGITRAWQTAAGHDEVALVTVPRPGAPVDLLWQRFASVLGTDVAGVDLEVSGNPSLGLVSLELLRRLNQRLEEGGEQLTPRGYERVVKHLLAKRGLTGRADDPRLGLDEAWVLERGARELERLRALQPRVVGDLDELVCEPVPGADPDDVSTDQLLGAGVDALRYAMLQLARTTAPEGDADEGAEGAID